MDFRRRENNSSVTGKEIFSGISPAKISRNIKEKANSSSFSFGLFLMKKIKMKVTGSIGEKRVFAISVIMSSFIIPSPNEKFLIKGHL